MAMRSMKLDPDSSTLIPLLITFCGASVQANMRDPVPRRRGGGEARLRRKDRSPRAAHLQTWAEHFPVWHFPPNAYDRADRFASDPAYRLQLANKRKAYD
jgi:hypothetical protein